MKEGIIKDTYEMIIKEMQTMIAVSYVLVVGIGMLFTFQKYIEFGVNIFDYADIFDFLIAPFADIRILAFSLVTIVLIILVYRLDESWKRKYPRTYSKINLGWDKKSWFNIYRYCVFGFLFCYYLYLSASLYGKITARQVMDAPPINLKYADNEVVRGILIGKTSDVLFLMENEKVVVIPISSRVKKYDVK